MGKKGTKRKTQWRTLSITEQDEINAAAAISSKGNYNNNGINTDEASSVDDNFKYSGTNYSYLKRKSSSFNSSSNLYNNNNYNIHINNNNNKNRTDYRNSDSNLNSYYNSNKQHNNNDTTTITNNSNITTTANRTNNTTPTNPNYHYNTNSNSNNNYNTTSSSSRYSYRRRPYSMQQNGGIGGGSSSSYKYYSSYGAGRATSRANRSYNDTITTTSNKENDYPKPSFNEDEYTRITTPRQDVIFKKGYFSRPRPYLSSNTDTNTTSSAAASVVSNEESMSATSVPSSLSPEQCSSSQSDSIPDQEHTLMYSYVDQNGIVYVNPYMPNGFDQYSGQMFMMPYGYSPYNIFPPDLNTPPLNENEIEEIDNDEDKNGKEITNCDDKNISDNLSNKDEQIENETKTIIKNSKSDLDNCDSVDDTSNPEESTIEPKDENNDESYSNENYTNINNHCLPNFINFNGFGGQYYPPMFYPLNMYGGQSLMPIIGGPGYDVPMNIIEHDDDEDGDGDDSDQSTNCTQSHRNKSRRDIQHTHRNSTGATTTDYSDDECSDNDDEVIQNIKEETIVKQDSTIIEEKPQLLSETETCETKLVDVTEKTNDEEICSSITLETDNKQIKFNANVEEFKPRIVAEMINNKPHLNVNVKEFLPRSYQTDSSSTSLDHDDSTIDITKKTIDNVLSQLGNKNVSLENAQTKCVSNNEIKLEKEIIKHQEPVIKKSTESVIEPKIIELTLAEKIKLSLAEENKRKLQPQSTIMEDVNLRKRDSKINSRETTKRNKVTNKKFDKSSSKFNKNKSTKDENTIQLPQSPSKSSITSPTEHQKSNNILSYAQMVNKDLNVKSSSQNNKSITVPHENNPVNIISDNLSNKDIDDDIDIQILLKSLDAADNLTAAKENISWQTVKPKGKRGKNYKDDDLEEIEPEHMNHLNEEVYDPVETIKKTKPLGNENKKKQIVVDEEPVKIEELLLMPTEETQVNNDETNKTLDVTTSSEKKKSRSKNRKSSSSSKKSSTNSKSLKINETSGKKNDEAINIQKTDKPDEDASNLARRLFEEIDLSLKTNQKESIEDDDLILGEIYSPNSNLMNKSFGRNSLDMMNGGFDYKYKNTSILKEEEEMVLNVIKSLSSNSSSASPIAGNSSNKNSFNIFNASFIDGIGKTAQRTNDFNDSVLKKTSITENLEKIIGNSDKKHVKLSTLEKKHNKLGISKKAGKNMDKTEVKEKVSKKSKNADKNNITNQLSDNINIVTEDNSELQSIPSPNINADDQNINDSSEYIKNCIQESFKWIEKSNIPKFSKTIEEHLISTSTTEDMKMNGHDIHDTIQNRNENIDDLVKENSDNIITEINGNANEKIIEQACEQILEEALAEECISACMNGLQIETLDDIQNNSSTELETSDKPAEEVTENDENNKIVEENCLESNLNCLIDGEDKIEPVQLENQELKYDEMSEILIDSMQSTQIQMPSEDQILTHKIENCQKSEENNEKCGASNDSLNNFIQENIISEVSHIDIDISQCNGVSELESITKSDEENQQHTEYIKNCLQDSYKWIDKSQLPNIAKNIEEHLTKNQIEDCSENGIEHIIEKVAISEVENNINGHSNADHNDSHNGSEINGFYNDSHSIHQNTLIQINGFNGDITACITQPEQITENEVQSIQIINETPEISENDDIFILNETIPSSTNEINTLITPLNLIESEDHKNEDISIMSNSKHLPQLYERIDDKLSKLSDSCEDANPRKFERESSTSSSTSLEIQLKLLQEQLMKFDEISIKPPDSGDGKDEILLINYNGFEHDNTINICHSIVDDETISNPNKFTKNNIELENCCDNSKTTTQMNTQLNHNIVKKSSESLLQFPQHKIELDSLEKFPLTQAVKLWLDSESKEQSPEPLLRIPDDLKLSSLISQQSLDQYNKCDNECDDDDDDDDTWSLTDDDDETNDNNLVNDNKPNGDVLKNGVIKNHSKNSKNLKSNPLHVSSVNKESSIINSTTILLMDNDSDYNSDSQLRYDDDNNTCERVAKTLSDLVQQQQQNNGLTKCDLLEYWDDEFIENPKKYLNPTKKNNINNNNIKQNVEKQNNKRINYERNESILSSGCQSTSSQNDLNNLIPYESVYGKTIDYNQLLVNNNYEFLSNNIINYNNINHIDNNNDDDTETETETDDDDNEQNKNIIKNEKYYMNKKLNHKNINNDTMLNKNNNNNNNNFDNNINNNNNNNCLKPPEVCCILM